MTKPENAKAASDKVENILRNIFTGPRFSRILGEISKQHKVGDSATLRRALRNYLGLNK